MAGLRRFLKEKAKSAKLKVKIKKRQAEVRAIHELKASGGRVGGSAVAASAVSRKRKRR
jgi:hypothetical protein